MQRNVLIAGLVGTTTCQIAFVYCHLVDTHFVEQSRNFPMGIVQAINWFLVFLLLEEYRSHRDHAVACLFVIFMWNVITAPVCSHIGSWAGIPISLLALPSTSFWLAKQNTVRPAFYFIYGCAGALVFVPRWLMMDRFHLWMMGAPPDAVLIAYWIAFALVMGACCYCFAVLASAVDRESHDQACDVNDNE